MLLPLLVRIWCWRRLSPLRDHYVCVCQQEDLRLLHCFCLCHADVMEFNWKLVVPITKQQRDLTIKDVMDAQIGGWDEMKLVEHIGFLNVRLVINDIPGPLLGASVEDRLMFKGARNGTFTLKSAYKTLQVSSYEGQNIPAQEAMMWKAIWKLNGVAPKIRVFIWKALHNVVPVYKTLHARIATVPVTCPICDDNEESVVHMLFRCQ